jgi:excisionase family DNA binding protein
MERGRPKGNVMHEAKDYTTDTTSDLFHRSVKYWAPVLDLSERTIRAAIAAGQLSHVRVGDRVLLSRRHIESWLTAGEKPTDGRAA